MSLNVAGTFANQMALLYSEACYDTVYSLELGSYPFEQLYN